MRLSENKSPVPAMINLFGGWSFYIVLCATTTNWTVFGQVPSRAAAAHECTMTPLTYLQITATTVFFERVAAMATCVLNRRCLWSTPWRWANGRCLVVTRGGRGVLYIRRAHTPAAPIFSHFEFVRGRHFFSGTSSVKGQDDTAGAANASGMARRAINSRLADV